jgi:NADPH:quinone reductase-like Zn-dependent oxidoreductase
LIEGTGGMSIFGLQLAKAAGAKVYATTSSNEKADRLLHMGCEAVFNYKEDNIWGKSVFRKSQGGVDHVLDVGGGSTMNQSIEAVKIGGQITAIGILSDGRKGSITFPKLFFKFINMRGIAVGSKYMQNDMIKAIELLRIKPIIDKSFAFDQLVDAFKYMETGQHFGKIILEW